MHRGRNGPNSFFPVIPRVDFCTVESHSQNHFSGNGFFFAEYRRSGWPGAGGSRSKKQCGLSSRKTADSSEKGESYDNIANKQRHGATAHCSISGRRTAAFSNTGRRIRGKGLYHHTGTTDSARCSLKNSPYAGFLYRRSRSLPSISAAVSVAFFIRWRLNVSSGCL